MVKNPRVNRVIMPTTNDKGGAGTLGSYRPAAEFDDATLAQKREYWRTKKREQRAKLSARRGRPKPADRGVNNASALLNSTASHTLSLPGPPLLNSDGSYQTGEASGFLLRGKAEDAASQHQKERWFQKIKLNKVFPQFPTSNPGPANGPLVKNPPIGGAEGRTFTSAKLNGVLPNASSSVPHVRVTVHPSGSVPRQLPSRMTSLNGGAPTESAQRNLATQGAPGPNGSNKTFRIQPRPLMAQTGINIATSHTVPVPIHKPGVQGANVTQQAGKKSALTAAPRVRGVNDASAAPASEEERAAKRREQWRLKKREQRAKQASQLAKARERTQGETTPSQRAGQLANVLLVRPPSVLSRDGQRQCLGRARTPFTTAGRLLKNAKAVAAFYAVPRQTGVALKKEANDLQPLGMANAVQLNANQSLQIKVEHQPDARTTVHTAVARAPIGCDKAVGGPSGRLSGHAQFSNFSRGFVHRPQRPRSVEIQRAFLGQRAFRGRFPALSAAFAANRSPPENPFETPEQRATRRREYWRVKKREQRAKLSAEVKAKMKEKDALMRRVKRYQSILEDMRRARMSGCDARLPQTIAVTHTNASETIGGFIKEDGTVTIPHMAPNVDKLIGGESRSFSTAAHQLPPGSAGGNASMNVMLGGHIRVNPPPPPLRPAQVKVSCPPIGQSVPKPPRLLSIRPQTALQNLPKNPPTHAIMVQPTSQITLSHPQSVRGAFPSVSLMGAKPVSCVMQMAVTSSRPLPPPPPLNLAPELTEEERMAKKREYWRVKKREQRAARATRQRQGPPAHGRGNAASQRRRNQRPVPNRRPVAPTANVAVGPKPNPQPLTSSGSSKPPQIGEIKREKGSTSPNDPNPKSEPPVSIDIKPPPSSPPVPPEPQPEPDPALSADSQATTLLAVASMKKLLEESLSTVAEGKSQQADDSTEQLPCKTEPETRATERGTEPEAKPNLPLLSLGDDEEEEEAKVSMAGDLSLDVKSWQVDPDGLPACQVSICPLSPDQLKLSPPSGEPAPLRHSCAETPPLPPPAALPPRGTHAHTGAPRPPLPRRAQRLRDKKAGHHHCCSPKPNEPAKLHHPPLLPQQQQQQHRQQQQQQPHSSASEQNMTLQKKREYWRVMKRQQRARTKARQRDGFRQGDYSRRLALKVAQSPNLCIIKTPKPIQTGFQAPPPALRPKPPPLLQPMSAPVSGAHASLTAVTNIPTLLVVTPPMSMGQPPDTLQVKPPLSSVSSSPQRASANAGTLPKPPAFSAVALPVGGGVSAPTPGERAESRLLLVENKQEAGPCSGSDPPSVRKWSLQVQDAAAARDAGPVPTLTPPANPLATIKLLPIQPTPSFRLPVTSRPGGAANSPGAPNPPSGDGRSRVAQWLPTSATGPPKPLPGESAEETLRRKREYWRVKKKEQRARKAMGDRDLAQRRAAANWKPILPAQDLLQGLDTQEQELEPGQWANTAEGAELLLSAPSETDLDYCSNLNYAAPIDDEHDLLFPDDDDGGGENADDDVSISEATWRQRYLMDHDPLNQLLVCMVCGDLQYSHSLEGVRAHIEEAHPDTLGLEAPERRRILEAWDEQVSRRERFFTSQLQHHGGPRPGDGSTLPGEVVMVDLDDPSQTEGDEDGVTKRP